jgi:hypothetical protein
MSITKGAVGLVYLTSCDVHERLFPQSSVTIEQALCHHTGLENDSNFLYDDYMAQSKTQNMYQYAATIFLNQYKSTFSTPHFAYNNIVFRILVQRFEALTTERLATVIRRIPGLAKAEFDTDVDGYMHGLNGMKLSCAMATAYGSWARDVLSTRSDLQKYPPIDPGHWSAKFAGNEMHVYPFFGWFIAVPHASPTVPMLAYSIGYDAQFVCVSLTSSTLPPMIQLRHPYYDDFGGKAKYTFVARCIQSISLLYQLTAF